MNKKVVFPAVIALILLLGAGAAANLGGSNAESNTNQQSVQGVSENTQALETTEKEADEAVEEATESSLESNATSTQQSNPATQPTNSVPAAPSAPSGSNTSDTTPAEETPTDDTPTTRGDSGGDIEIIDVVPVPTDDGGPTVEPTPIRGGTRGPSVQ